MAPHCTPAQSHSWLCCLLPPRSSASCCRSAFLPPLAQQQCRRHHLKCCLAHAQLPPRAGRGMDHWLGLHTPGRGACFAQRQRVPRSPRLWLHWPWSTHCPHRRQDGRSTALLPSQPWVPQSRDQLEQPWLPPLGSPSTGCRQAKHLAQASLGHEGMGNQSARSCSTA